MDNLPKPEIITKPPSLPKIPLIISGVILILAIILGLKYFNLLPSFNLIPQNQPKVTSKPSPTPVSKVTLSCPVKKDSCKPRKTVNLPGSNPPTSVLTYSNLATNSAVLAMTDGKFMTSTTFTITNPDLGIKIIYEFQPAAYTSSGAGEIDIKQGDPVGRIYKGDLVISIQNLKGKEFINLGSFELTKK